MNGIEVLVTGDFWHQEFSKLIRMDCCSTTVQPIELACRELGHATTADLVVIAQSRRGIVSQNQAEKIVERFPDRPVVSLLGSWCEGEERSGSPIPGTIRIYWHQWNGRVAGFLWALERNRLSSWQMPKICSLTDRIQQEAVANTCWTNAKPPIVISALTDDAFAMLADAVSGEQQDCVRFELLDGSEAAMQEPKVVLIDGNSLTANFHERVEEIRAAYPASPLIGLLNFPRLQEQQLARSANLASIVSKPFQLADLRAAIEEQVVAKVVT